MEYMPREISLENDAADMSTFWSCAVSLVGMTARSFCKSASFQLSNTTMLSHAASDTNDDALYETDAPPIHATTVCAPSGANAPKAQTMQNIERR